MNGRVSDGRAVMMLIWCEQFVLVMRGEPWHCFKVVDVARCTKSGVSDELNLYNYMVCFVHERWFFMLKQVMLVRCY